jgi:hypothetical protein
VVEGAVGEESTSDTFSDICVEVILKDAQLLVVDIDLDSF